MPRRALITGITGQDGSYLAELLLDKGYEVHGMVRRLSSENHHRLEAFRDRITLHTGDLLDQRSLGDVMRALRARRDLQPGGDVVRRRLLEPAHADRRVHRGRRDPDARGDAGSRPEARFYQASSSEMFGKVRETPQNELTPFYPRSPYGVAKVYAHFITVNYRESYGLYACSGILFNHESPRRSLEFVTRKITHTAAAIKLGLADGAGARQPRRAPRLGLRARLRRRDVADAAARRARGLRGRHRRRPLGRRPRRHRLRLPRRSTRPSTCARIPPSCARPRSIC